MPRSLASSRTLGTRTLRNRTLLARPISASLNIGALTTDGVATVADSASIQNIFATGGAFGFWINPRSLGGSSNGFFLFKGWSVRLLGTFVPRFTIPFSGVTAQFRFTGVLTPFRWNFVFAWYDGSSTSNIPVPYIGLKDGTISKMVPSVAASPTGTISTDAGLVLKFGNNVLANGMDALLTDVRFYTGSEPSQADVEKLFYTGANPSTLTLKERWASGTTSFDSDSGTNNAVLTSPATVDGVLPFKARTLVA